MATIYFNMEDHNLGTGQGNFAVKVKGKKETLYFTNSEVLKEMLDLMGVQSVHYGGGLEKLENAA